jgi:S1-C subfamily serine protease
VKIATLLATFLATVIAASSVQANTETPPTPELPLSPNEGGAVKRLLPGTVVIGLVEPKGIAPDALYFLPGQRPNWLRKLVNRIDYGTWDVTANASGGMYFEAGMGAVIARDRVLTAAHVITDARSATRVKHAIWLRFNDGRRVRAEVEAISPHFDAAILRFKLDGDPPAILPIAESMLQPTREAVLYPAHGPDRNMGWLERGRTVRFGIIETGASIIESQYGWEVAGYANHGTSGGPVVNARGELVALVSGSVANPDHFYAVPADSALRNIAFWQHEQPDRLRVQCLRPRTKTL